MAVYSVFEPPPRKGETAERPERFAFVRDGFSWGAFLFGPLWMLACRLWLVLVLYLAVVLLLSSGMTLAAVPTGGQIAVAALVALLLGLEGATLRRWTLQRRRWRDLGIVVADDVESAERRFFDGWVAGETATNSPLAATAARNMTAPVAQQYTGASDVIGLFPQPEMKR